jgi:tRNA U55 pseudouridine synthase TruB
LSWEYKREINSNEMLDNSKTQNHEQINNEIISREVQNSEMESHEMDTIDVIVRCSSGTYVRALARDLGEMLGVGATIAKLRRTKIGDFSVEDANKTLSVYDAISKVLPVLFVEQKAQKLLENGVMVDLRSKDKALLDGQELLQSVMNKKNALNEQTFAVFNAQQSIIAITTLDSTYQTLVPKKVFK